MSSYQSDSSSINPQYDDTLPNASSSHYEPEIFVAGYGAQEKKKIGANISKESENKKAKSVEFQPEIHVAACVIEDEKKGAAQNTSDKSNTTKAHLVEPEPMAATYANLETDHSRQHGGHNNTLEDDRKAKKAGSRRQVGGAAVLGGVAGLMVGGPLTAVVGAGGAAALASSHGEAGDWARKYGDKVANAGCRLKKLSKENKAASNKSRDLANGDHEQAPKVKDVDETRKSGNVISQASFKVRKFDEKHQFVAKASERIKKFDEKHKVVAQASERFNKFDEKHHVVDKATKGFVTGCKWVSKNMNNSSNQASNHAKGVTVV
jgi:hypothetical protein